MGEIIELRLTKKAIYRAAVREMMRLYKLSAGGLDPLIDEATRELFEQGEVDEVSWITWNTYCNILLATLNDF